MSALSDLLTGRNQKRAEEERRNLERARIASLARAKQSTNPVVAQKATARLQNKTYNVAPRPQPTIRQNVENATGTVGGGIFNFANSMTKAPQIIGRGVGNTIATFSPDYKSAEESARKLTDIDTQVTGNMFKLARSGTPEQRQRAVNYLNKSQPTSNGMNDLRTQIASENDPKRLAAAAGSLGFDLATLGVAGASKAGIKTAYQAGKASTGKVTTGLVQATKRFGVDTAKTASMGAVSGAAYPLIENPNATAKEMVQGAAMGAVAGAALPTAFVGAGYAKSAIKPTTQLVKNTSKTIGSAVNKVAQAIPQTVQKADDAIVKKVNPVYGQLLETRQKAQIAYDRATTPKEKEVIGKYLVDLNTEIRKSQAGSIGGEPMKIPQAPKAEGVAPDPLMASEKRTNKGLGELSNIRKQYANDQEFFDKVILENQDVKGEIGDFARHIARRDATEGSIYNKNYLTEILDDELSPINSKLDQAVAKTAQRDELAKTIRDFEKSTGQTGLYKKVSEAMRGMNEQEQIDFMGKALKDMRDNGLMAADYLNKQSGYTPKPKSTTPPKGVAPKSAPIEKTPQPKSAPVETPQVGKTTSVQKFGWNTEETPQGTKLFNRNGKHVATITEKKGRYTASYTDGTRIATGSDANKLAEDVARKTFYAQELPQSKNQGGTLRPDKAPEPYKNTAIQSELSPERASVVQASSDKMKSALEFDKTPTPKKAYHSTGSLEIEGGKLRASGADSAMGEGVYLHTNPETAKYAGAMQSDGNIADQTALDVNLKTDNLFKWADQEYPTPKQVALIKNRGYDGIYKKGGEIVVFDPNKVEITKSGAPIEKTPIHPAQQKVVDDYAAMLEQIDSQAKGGQLQKIEDGTYGGTYTRTSEHSPFYRKIYAETGRKPTKQQWKDEALRQLRDGQGDEYAIKEFNDAGNPELQSLLNEADNGAFGKQPVGETFAVPPVQKPQSPFEKALPQASGRKTNGQLITQPQQSLEISSPAQTIESQATQGQEIKVAEPYPASQTSNQKAASSYTNNTPPVKNNMDKKAYREVFGVDPKAATKDVIQKDPKKLAEKLAELDKQDKTAQLNRAAREAQLTGKEFNFFGKLDKNGRSVGIEAFNPDKHRIEAGLVVDEKGNFLGNHIKIDETGISTGVGGTYHNVTDVFGEVDKWGNKYKITETLERNVMNNAPDKETGKKVVKWLIHSKNKNEAAMKTAARSMMQKNNARYKAVMSGKPITTRKATVMADSMAYGEGKLTKQEVVAKYGENYGNTITSNMDEMRLDYDNYLDQINKVRKQYGQDEIPKRKDYITHVQELNSSQSFAGEVFGDLKNSITGEGMETTRGAVPADIAGRTENFKPKSKWNPFLQQRTGSQNYVKNPFEAFDRYILPAEHNIHMTESVTRARVAEEVFRAAKNFDNLDKQNLGKLITDDLQKAAGDAVPDSLTKGFMEYANSLAGKTNRLDRTVMDWSPATAKGVKGWQALQRTAGRATIPGNIKSIMMQPLSQVNVFSQVSIPSYTKGMAKWIKNDKIIEQSPFIKARQTTVDSMFRGKLSKATDAAGVPLQKVEMQSVKLAWYAQYEDALRKGLKGADAVAEADRLTERAVSGRGIGDKPELYRSTVTNGLLQYTLEVMGQSKMFWKDLTPAQKVKWMAGAAAINTMYAFVANDKPLPDYIDAAYESYKDFTDPEDDRSGLEKVGGTAQRFAGETVKFNPIASKVAQSLPKNVKTSVFGSDSDVTRYDGAAAAARVLSNWWDAGVAVKDGDLVTARNKALKTMPVGNQAEKTLTGAEMLARGYDINDKGERTFDAPTGFVDKSRAVLFGPNATNAAKEYYANPQGYSSSQKKKADAKSGVPTKLTLDEAKDIQKKEYGGKYAKMTEDEISQLAKTDSEANSYLKSLDATKAAYGKTPDLPKDLNDSAKKLYERQSRLTTEGKDKWNKLETTDQNIKDSLKQWNRGRDLPVITNEVAKEWADYQKDLIEGKISKMKADGAKKAILKKAYNSQLNDDEKEIYKFSEADLLDGLNRGLITDANIENALKVEKQLFDSGLIKQETLARKFDLPARGYKTTKSRSGSKRTSSRKSSSTASSVFIPKTAYSMSGIYSQVSGTQKKLRNLLDNARV